MSSRAGGKLGLFVRDRRRQIRRDSIDIDFSGNTAGQVELLEHQRVNFTDVAKLVLTD